MTPIVSIIMGSTSDLPVMEKAAAFLNEMKVPFEMNALSAHRTPEAVEAFAKGAAGRGIRVIIAAAGMAAHLPGVIAASTTVPVIGVPIKSTLEGMDALLAIVQMPPGIPVATVGINAAMNAAILAVQMLSLADRELADRFTAYKENLKKKIEKANEETSIREIRAIIQHCIEHEDKKQPLTDEQLMEVLKQKGFELARRTVAKYRQQLGIPVARMRR